MSLIDNTLLSTLPGISCKSLLQPINIKGLDKNALAFSQSATLSVYLPDKKGTTFACGHVTMNSEYTITMQEDQFVCYIMLATVRYTNRSSHTTQSSTCALQPLALVNLCLSFLPHANFVINGNCNKIVRYHDFISHIHITLRPIG